MNLAALGQSRRSLGGVRTQRYLADSPPALPSPVTVSVPRENKQVPVVRRIGAAWLRQVCGMPEDRVETALVVLSELLTNAVVHGAGPSVGYRSWSPQQGLVQIEIDDGTAMATPQPAQAQPWDESGRGLFLVRVLVQELGGDWGFNATGTTAWCRLSIHSAPTEGGRGDS
ncbi:ATP-binding protein [Streptomyces longispororuber]|uniref:ATP-binding protein n=1 Tax=Streptomyces longispororuber TaxID=68230 RepID=UPI00210AC9B0|nr:ATP-binding protein [Streptomyces longispororuber]MCQ4210409.1 ATP-binding protein [Streptomyces longispororuber]